MLSSPYQMQVRPTVEPSNVKVTGPGVDGKPVPASIPVDFTIDTKEAGFGDLEVNVVVSQNEKFLLGISIKSMM